MDKWERVGGAGVMASGFGKTLLRQDFINPQSGERVDYYFWGSNKVPAIVLAITTDNLVVLVRTFRHAALDVFLELPGGNKNEGEEDFSVTARRELVEETGYEPNELISLSRSCGGIWFEPSSLLVPFHPFLALGCKSVKTQSLDENELVEVVTMPLAQWVDLALSGEIRDAKSIATTALALKYIK